MTPVFCASGHESYRKAYPEDDTRRQPHKMAIPPLAFYMPTLLYTQKKAELLLTLM